MGSSHLHDRHYTFYIYTALHLAYVPTYTTLHACGCLGVEPRRSIQIDTGAHTHMLWGTISIQVHDVASTRRYIYTRLHLGLPTVGVVRPDYNWLINWNQMSVHSACIGSVPGIRSNPCKLELITPIKSRLPINIGKCLWKYIGKPLKIHTLGR